MSTLFGGVLVAVNVIAMIDAPIVWISTVAVVLSMSRFHWIIWSVDGSSVLKFQPRTGVISTGFPHLSVRSPVISTV